MSRAWSFSGLAQWCMRILLGVPMCASCWIMCQPPALPACLLCVCSPTALLLTVLLLRLAPMPQTANSPSLHLRSHACIIYCLLALVVGCILIHILGPWVSGCCRTTPCARGVQDGSVWHIWPVMQASGQGVLCGLASGRMFERALTFHPWASVQPRPSGLLVLGGLLQIHAGPHSRRCSRRFDSRVTPAPCA